MLLFFQDDRSTTLSTILESHRVQRRHAKLKQTANNEPQKSIFLGIRETSQEKTPPPDKRLSVMTNDLITFCQVRSRF